MGTRSATLLLIGVAALSSVFVTQGRGPWRDFFLHNTSQAISGSVAYPQEMVLEGSLQKPQAGLEHAVCSGSSTEQPLWDTIRGLSSSNQWFTQRHPEITSLDSNEHPSLFVSPGTKIEFIVAIVPDPMHTHLALIFDRSIEAVQQSAQRSKYIFDRAYMPWNNRDHPESTDFRIGLQEKSYETCKEEIPGLMIFRAMENEEAAHGLLFVFIVGEKPTSGPNRKQFRNALRFIQVISDGREHIGTLSQPLRILGPTFSGSLDSLAQLLNGQQCGTKDHPLASPCVSVYSGTVTGWQTIQSFDMELAQIKIAKFVTFQETDRYELRKFLAYAMRNDYKPDEIAVLAEDESAFGSQLTPVGPLTHACPAFWSSDSQSKDVDIDTGERCVVRLFFPREISQLRSAWQRDIRQGEISESTSQRPARTTLPLNLEDTGNDDDSVASYSRVQTPLSQESALLGIVTALFKHHTRFIFLQATDPADQLFLVRYLRSVYPDGRIVTSGADLLFRREVDDTLLRGVLAVSTYSLLPGADDETWHSDLYRDHVHAENVFPSSYSVGTYNATLALLALDDHVLADELPVAPYAEYGWPKLAGYEAGRGKSLRPVLWLTVLGRVGYWPLAILDAPESGMRDEVSGAPDSVSSVLLTMKGNSYFNMSSSSWDATTQWRLLCSCGIALGVIFLLLIWWSSFVSASESMAQFATVEDKRRTGLLCFGAWLILVTLLLLLLP
jgi:hypothetical protein